MTTANVKPLEKMKKDFQKLSITEDKSDEMLPLVMNYLTPALIEEAKKDLHETEEIKQKALTEMRRMIAEEKNLVSPTHDLFLLAFLRCRKYDVKKAFKILQNYWKFRRDYTKILSVMDIDKSMILLLDNFVGILDRRDRKGCPIVIAKLGMWDTDKYPYENIFRCVTALLVNLQEQEATQIAGFRAIIDFRGVTWRQMKYCTPANFLLVVRSTQFCYPARYKGIHIVCESKTVNLIWGMLCPFLTTKLRKRIFYHGEDLKPIREFIHPSVLPKEYGGEGPPLDNGKVMDFIKSRVDGVTSQLNYGYQN